jgi:hypothetical protein
MIDFNLMTVSIVLNAILFIGIFYQKLVPKIQADGFQNKDVTEALTETKQTIEDANEVFQDFVKTSKQVIEDRSINDTDTVKIIKDAIEKFEKEQIKPVAK